MGLRILVSVMVLCGVIAAGEWKLFAPLDEKTTSLEGIVETPEVVNGVAGKTVEFVNDRYVDDQKTIPPGKVALFVQSLESDEDKTVAMGWGANYYLKAYVNGELVLDHWKYGTKPFTGYRKSDFVRNVHLKKGRNIVAVYVSYKKGTLTLGCGLTPDRDPAAEAATKEHYAALLADFPRTGDARKLAERIITNGVAEMTSGAFGLYVMGKGMVPAEIIEANCKDMPILSFWEGALDKVLREIPETHPREGEVVLWHLYNMGYVVKTEKSCFGIDIFHRRAEELVPYLDFTMVTHMHSDHYSRSFLEAMVKNGKPVISSFFDCATRLKLGPEGIKNGVEKEYKGNEVMKKVPPHMQPGHYKYVQKYCRYVEPAVFDFGDVHIETAQSDHNPGLPKFITDYRIRCGTGERPLVIYHTGDSHRHDQLNPAGPVDVHINHPKVGMQEKLAAEKIRPKYVFFSHLLEMGHCPPSPWAAVPFEWVVKDSQEVEALGCKAVSPFWGEKFVFVNGKLIE